MGDLASLLRVEPVARSRLEDLFVEEPVSLDVFVRDKKFLGNPPLGPVQYEAVRHTERIFFPWTYPLMAEFSPYWAQPVRMINFATLMWGKGCILPDEELYDARSGQWRAVAETGATTTAAVSGAGSPGARVGVAAHGRPFRRGSGECFRVRTASGLSIGVYGGHQFLTRDGFRQLWSLDVGDEIAQVTTLPCTEPVLMDERELQLLGWWLGDGIMPSTTNVKSGLSMIFGFAEERSLAAYLAVCAELGVDCNVRQREGKKCWYVNSTTASSGYKKRNPLIEIADRHGLRGKTAYNARVPAAVFSCPEDQIALFLARLWETDGWVSAGTRPCEVGYSSVSEGLVQDVQRLLLRLGIGSDVRVRKQSGFGIVTTAYEVRLRRQSDVRQFCAVVPLLDKAAKQRQVIETLDGRPVWGRRPRERDDIRYSKIVSIEPLGVREYWDLTVPGPANYVAAGGLVNHNSGKDHVCRVVSLRIAYLLQCLKDPQGYFDIPGQDTIHMLNVASSTTQATQAFFTPLTRAVSRGWFADKCHPKPGIGLISWDKNVEMISGHADAETQEGLNLILGVADEIDAFRTKDSFMRNPTGKEPLRSAEGILKMLRTSASTRFPETFKNIRISYPRHLNSIISKLVAQARLDNERYGEKSRHYVSGPLATWDVNPRYDGYSRVTVPGATQPIPDLATFIEDYLEDPIMARTTYECRPQRATEGYFRNMAAFHAAVEGDEQPISVDYRSVVTTSEVTGTTVRMWEPVFTFDPSFRPVDGACYAMHADLAVKGDRAGVAMSHVSHWITDTVVYAGEDGSHRQQEIRRPVVKVDFVISFEASVAVEPPREIQIRWARQLAFELVRRGFNLMTFTFDGFQSTDSMQILSSHGIESKRVSADMSEDPWRSLRDVTYDSRLEMPFSLLLFSELEALSRANGKVDHPSGGSKDLADALACSVLGALTLGGAEWDGADSFTVADTGIMEGTMLTDLAGADPGDYLALPVGPGDLRGLAF